MRAHKFTLALASLAAVGLTAWVGVAQQTRQVNDETLLDAGRSGDEWVSYNVNWSEQRYSPLKQINASNVSKLGFGWSYDIPNATGNPQNRHEATPLMFNGVIYSIAPWSVVYAVDARTGKEIWKSDPDVNQQVWQSRICCGVVNRGIALYEGKVIAPVVDGRLRAYDAATGRVLWDTRVSPENMAYTITMAPRVIKGGKIIVGVSGGEYGVRGFFDAYDVNTGQRAWRFYTVPGDPSKPFEDPILAEWAKSWSGEWWKIGGGAPVWNGFAYDPESDVVFVGSGQPGPWTSMHRGDGDALCSNCIIAVRGSTGKYVWHYQTTPGDDWDFDSIADIMLADINIGGKPRKVLMHAPKNGFFYVIDRRTGELLAAEPWVTVSWASGIDMRTGRPRVNPEARYGTDAVSVMPGPGGGHVWPPMSYNPTTGLVYIPSTIGGAYTFQANPDYVPLPTDIGLTGRGQMNMGTGAGKGGGAPKGGAAKGGGAPPPGLAPGLDPAQAKGGPPPAGAGAGKGGPAPAAGAPTPSRLVALVLDGTTPLPGIPEVAAGAGPGAGKGGPGGPGGGKGKQGPPAPPSIGPTGNGNILSAWDPITMTERWRAQGGGAGFNQGGTLSTGGNLVFSSVNNRLLVFRADNGQLLLDLATGLTQMGPPMTFMLDGKQVVMVAGGPAQQGGGFGGGAGAAKGGPAPGAAKQ